MANGFGSMFIGVAGLQSSQNALNVTSNNLANLDTTGYVRQSVLFADRDYVTFNTTAAISNQQSAIRSWCNDRRCCPFKRCILRSVISYGIKPSVFLCIDQ